MHDCWELRKWVCVLRAARRADEAKGRATWPFFWSPSSLLWLLTALDPWAAPWFIAELPGSAWHSCLPPWRARFHCATLCSKLLITTNGNRSSPRVNWRLTKQPPAWQLLVSAKCVCSQGLLENLNTFSVKDTFIPFLRKATSYDNTELKSSKCFTLPDKRQTQEDGNYFMFFSSVKSTNLLSSFNSLYWVWQSLFCHSVLLPNRRAIFPSAL